MHQYCTPRTIESAVNLAAIPSPLEMCSKLSKRSFFFLQLDQTGDGLNIGLNDCIAINSRLETANKEAQSIRERLGLRARSTLTTDSKGIAGLGTGARELGTAANEALQLNVHASSISSQISNFTLQSAEVCNDMHISISFV